MLRVWSPSSIPRNTTVLRICVKISNAASAEATAEGALGTAQVQGPLCSEGGVAGYTDETDKTFEDRIFTCLVISAGRFIPLNCARVAPNFP